MIFRQIEVEFLGDRARAHIGLKNFLYARHLKPGFFFRFGLNPAFRVKVIEQPGGRLNEILFVIIDKHRETELTRQNDGFAVAIIEQDRRAIPPVIHFTLLPLPVAIAALEVKSVFFQVIPVVGQRFAVDDAYICTF